MKLDDLIQEEIKKVKNIVDSNLTTREDYYNGLAEFNEKLANGIKDHVDELIKPAKRKQYLIAAACFLTGLTIGIII
jgi:hypothetical protein